MPETPEPSEQSTDKKRHPVKPGDNFFYNSSRERGRRETTLLGYGEHEGGFIGWYQVVGDTRKSWQYLDRLMLSAGTSSKEEDNKPVDFIVNVKRSEKTGSQIEGDWRYVGYVPDSNPSLVRVEKEGEQDGQPVVFSEKVFVENLAKWNGPQE